MPSARDASSAATAPGPARLLGQRASEDGHGERGDDAPHFVDGNEKIAPSRTPAEGQRCVMVFRFV